MRLSSRSPTPALCVSLMFSVGSSSEARVGAQTVKAVRKAAKRGFSIARGEGLHADRAGVPISLNAARSRNSRSRRSEVPSAGHVGDLNRPNPWQTLPHDEIKFPSPIRTWQRSTFRRDSGRSTYDTNASVSSIFANGTSVVDAEVQVLEHEGDAALGAKVGDPAQRVARLEPHRSRHDLARRDRNSAFAEPGAVKIEAGDIQALADLDRLRAVASRAFAPLSSESLPLV